MGAALRLLLVEDSEDDAELTLLALKRGGMTVQYERVQTKPEMQAALLDKTWDVIVSDYSMPEFSAPEAFATLLETGLDIPFLIVSGTIGEETAVQAMKLGVHDFLIKGNLKRLVPAIERELRECEGRKARLHAEEGRKRAEASLRETEDQLRQAQKMEAIGRLAGGVAHDFNNLLSIILGFTSFAVEALEESSPLREDLQEVLHAANRATELTRQLLTFSRQQVSQPRVLDLSQVLLGIEKMLRRVLGEDVELAIVPPHEGGKVSADPGQVEQVLMNLVVNARDAMPQGGTITLGTDNVALDDSYAALGVPAGEYVQLYVTDTGTGMDKATEARIFEPFFTTKGVGKGTGLGLSTVYGIVKQSGGHITVHSELGKGTTFKVFFPRTDKPQEEQKPISVAPGSLKGNETILVVEDEEAVRRIMCTVLRRLGYDVLEAQNGGEAFLICEKRETPIDLLVTDVIMPRMSGRELVDRLAPTRPGMKILYVSGYADTALADHGVENADVPFLQKPITPDVFARKVREVLQR